MSAYYQSLPSLARLCRYEKKYGLHKLRKYLHPLLGKVLRTGYAVIPGYWDAQRCIDACRQINNLLDTPEVKVWSDAVGCDKRIMGVENLSPTLDLFHDSYVHGLITALYNQTELVGFTMGARLDYTENNLGSGQGWHRDSAVVHQFKAILYLSDTGPKQGPFQYYKHSGNIWDMYRLESLTGISIDDSRLEDKQAQFEQAGMNMQEFCAPAGTLLIVNTRGIHRGKPIEQGCRYALTNYYWTYPQVPQNIQPWLNNAAMQINLIT